MRTTRLRVGESLVACHQSSGNGPALVLCHGNSSSSRAFRHQLDGALGGDLRLVAIDWPGHGESDDARDPAVSYSVPGYARVLLEVTKQLELQSAVFLGWSLGGHVVLEAADALRDARGFFISGAPPVARAEDAPRALSTDPSFAPAFRGRSTPDEVRAYLASFFAEPPATIPSPFAEDFARTDEAARAALGASIARNDFRDEVRIVGALAKPLAIIHGTRDRIVQRAYLGEVTCPTLWRGAIQEMVGIGHTPQWEAPAQFDGLVRAFVSDCTKD